MKKDRLLTQEEREYIESIIHMNSFSKKDKHFKNIKKKLANKD